MISSGESMLDIARYMKAHGAGRFFGCATYALFTGGLESFDKAYEDGLLDAVFSTNLTYMKPELRSRPWFVEVDCSKYIAYVLAALNHEVTLSSLLDPHVKIAKLIGRYHSDEK